MRAEDLRQGIAHARHVLICVQTGGRTTGFESTRVEDQRGLTLSAAAAERRNLELSCTCFEQKRLLNPTVVRVHLRRIAEHVRETDKRVRKHRLIGHRGAKHVSDGAGNRVRSVLSNDRTGIRNLVALAPPEAYRERLLSRCMIVANKNLRVIADVVVTANDPLLVVLTSR